MNTDTPAPTATLSQNDYTATIRPFLSKAQLQKSPWKLAVVALHLLIIFSCYWGFRHAGPWWQYLLLALITGHSLGCLGFLTHDLSHGTILRNGWRRELLERFLFSFNAISTTMWRKTHNQLHHRHTNTPADPDRKFLAPELTRVRKFHSSLFWPNRHFRFTRPLVLLKFTTYLFSHTIGALTPAAWTPVFVTRKASYKPIERLKAGLELACILALWLLIFLWLEGDWYAFIWAVPVPLALSSAVLMSYILTNHCLATVTDTCDPVGSSVSVIVPRVCDLLHDNISYHTEHHLFPSIDPQHYPAISALLQKHYPERYRRIPFGSAWRALWQCEIHADSANPQATGKTVSAGA